MTLPSRFPLTRVPSAHVAIAGFDGPLDLLLHQLGQGHIEITSISLAEVAEHYLATIRLIPADAQRLDFLADFLVVASQLLVLKSRALLPREAARVDEPEVVNEQVLAERLAEYRRYRAAAARLHERHTRGERAFPRLAPPPLPVSPYPVRLEPASPEHLARALQRLLAARQPTSEPETVPRLTIGDRMAHLRSTLREHGRIAFLTIASQCATRADLILTFLAVLELYRSQEIDLTQDALFGEIWLTQAGASRYQ